MDVELKKIKQRENSRKYYQSHKEEILAKQYEYKKKKYAEDPEYRKKVYKNSRRWVSKNREKVYFMKRKWQVEHRNPTKDEIIQQLQQKINKAIELIKYAGGYDEKNKVFCDDIWEELPEILNVLE